MSPLYRPLIVPRFGRVTELLRPQFRITIRLCRQTSLLNYEAKEKELRLLNYGVAFEGADREHGLSLGRGRRRSGPLRPPLVPQPGRSARRAERLSSAGCCIDAPNTSAAVLPRERSGARKHQTPWAC